MIVEISIILVLSYLTARLHVLGRSYYAQRLIEIYGRENHSLTFDAHHFAGCKVGDKKNALADEFLGMLIESCNAGAYGAVCAAAVVDGELQKFL